MGRRRDVLVLCCHAVSEEWPSSLAVRPQALESYVTTLLDAGFEPVTFVEATSPGEHGKMLAITFDDAFLSVYETARPILAHLGAPATVFVPTSHIGLAAPRGWEGTSEWLNTAWAAELAHMSWAQLAELAERGWEIGSHTCTHPHLQSLGDAALEEEMQSSRREIERRLGTPCRSLAYPFGEADGRVREAAAAAGYEAACVLSRRVPVHGGPDPLLWPRLALHGSDSPGSLKAWLFEHSPRGWNAAQAGREITRRLRSARPPTARA